MVRRRSGARIRALPFNLYPTQSDSMRRAHRTARKSGLVFRLCCVAFSLTTTALVSANDLLGPCLPSMTMPAPGMRTDGFRTTVRVSQQTTVGYLPIEISLEAQGALPAERRLVYRFSTVERSQSPPQNAMVVDVPILVPQGTRSAKWIRYLPKWSAGLALEVLVMEATRPIANYSGVMGDDEWTRRWRGSAAKKFRELMRSEYATNWIFVSADDELDRQNLPNLRSVLKKTYADIPVGVSVPDSASPLFSSRSFDRNRLLTVGQQSLPTDWRGYQQSDAVILNVQSLERLVDKEKPWAALRGWVLNGGSLVIYDAESPEAVADVMQSSWTNDEEARKRIEGYALKFNSDLELAEKQQQSLIDTLRKQLSQVSESSSGSRSPSNDASTKMIGERAALEKNLTAGLASMALLAEVPRHSEIEWSQLVSVQPFGGGEVIALRRFNDGEIPPNAYWQIVEQEVDFRASPVIRRGVDPMVGDSRFFRWMIPGVAQPPVYTFIGLLAAFVVLVGPVAYRHTTRHGRGYLMFAIAPLLALITTLAMFGYGIVSDGLGTVTRVRQLTWVDGRSGDAGERVRSTYFAGIRPGDGLRFAGDAEVFGHREGTGDGWADLERLPPMVLGEVTVREESQEFSSAFLPSRQQKQFVSHQPRLRIGHLQLSPDPDGIQSPDVTNEFTFPLRDTVIRDSGGAYWKIKEILPGQTIRCTPLTSQDASKALGKLYNDHRPISAVRESRRRNRYTSVILDVMKEFGTGKRQNITTGVFEHWLQSHLQTQNEIPKTNFVGISDVSPDVIAVENCELSSSVHYVFGTLR